MLPDLENFGLGRLANNVKFETPHTVARLKFETSWALSPTQCK